MRAVPLAPGPSLGGGSWLSGEQGSEGHYGLKA